MKREVYLKNGGTASVFTVTDLVEYMMMKKGIALTEREQKNKTLLLKAYRKALGWDLPTIVNEYPSLAQLHFHNAQNKLASLRHLQELNTDCNHGDVFRTLEEGVCNFNKEIAIAQKEFDLAYDSFAKEWEKTTRSSIFK